MSGKSDAATTTDDMKPPPLCLFYFSHPFGILSPNPPSMMAAPPHCLPAWLPTSATSFTPDGDCCSSSTPSFSHLRVPITPIATAAKKKLSSSRGKSNRLPPLDRTGASVATGRARQAPRWPEAAGGFRRRSFLPPIDMSRAKAAKEQKPKEEEEEEELDGVLVKEEDDDEDEDKRKLTRMKRRRKRRIRPLRSSSRGVVKGRSGAARSATRKLLSYLVSATRRNRVSTAALPPLSEVLRTVRQAWGSPKSLLPEDLKQDEIERLEKSVMGMNPPLLPGASPGLLRRRYSLPETVMRKYKLAQNKSDSDESEIGSAPSPRRMPSPMMRANKGTKEHRSAQGPRSSLLRRIWGGREPAAPPFGGSHSELRYWDSRSGSSSPDRGGGGGCEACKRLSDKNLSSSSSPPPARRRQIFALDDKSSPDRSSLNRSDGSSSKLGLSSLVTSSYPVTDDMTRSSASFTSESNKSSPTLKKRRQSEEYTPITTTTTTTTTATSDSHTTRTRRETTSPTDSAMSTHTGRSTDRSDSPKGPKSDSPSSRRSDDDDKPTTEPKSPGQVESDTGIEVDTDSTTTKNADSSTSNSDNSKEGSVTWSEEGSTDPVTCIERTMMCEAVKAPPAFECLEVVVSETLNSSAFKKDDVVKPKLQDVNSNGVPACESRISNRLDIDQYVSNILIDSLNTMTDQINEINSNVDDDLKLNILEKEIKVKLRSVSASPITINPIITTLITNIPDKELLETTVIEEKTRSLAYTTESKLFSMDNSVKIENKNIIDDEKLEVNRNVESDHNSSVTVEERALLNRTVEEILNNNDNSLNNNDENFYTEKAISNSPLPYDINENEPTKPDDRTKAVLRQLHKMFESSRRSSLEVLDSNFNVCNESNPQTFFCGTQTNDISHLEMSTDVDVFVDNSLNKMMNSIDINYNEADLCESIEKIVFDKLETKELSNAKETPEVPPIAIKEASDSEKSMISNIGAGSLYQKPLQRPLVVPRYSAVPYSDSMEVNTSSEEDDRGCQSDCMSLVDSLDDPNSPRPLVGEVKRSSKHDKKLVRGGIMSLLPENSAVPENDAKSSRDRGETFFVPIKETPQAISGNVIVAEHMPEKIKERLYERQQKRELRKEHHRRKKLKLLKREMERQKKTTETAKADTNNKQQNRTAENDKSELKNNTQAVQKEFKKSPVHNRPTPSTKSDKIKFDENLKNLESFVVDKRGNIQSNILKPSVAKAKPEPAKVFETNLYSKSRGSNAIESVEKVKVLKTKRDLSKIKLKDSGPRRVYQKSEFVDGQKHVEILEIVECVEESSPEPSDDGCESPVGGNKQRTSKIPVLQKVSKKSANGRSIRSPKGPNSKTDQLIANILIDAFNEDNPENRDVQLVLSPRDKKLSTMRSLSGGQPSVKYSRKFDAIPEERGNLSVESSNEDLNNAAKARAKNKVVESVKRQDVSTSPIPRFATVATSPIPPPHPDELGTKEGWPGFCKPQIEGSHPSSNIPSDRESVGTIPQDGRESEERTAALSSQSSLRTIDSRERSKRVSGSPKIDTKPPNGRAAKNPVPKNEIATADSKSNATKAEGVKLPSPFRYRNFSQCSELTTSSGSDSEAGGPNNCPVLAPRWPPIAGPRNKRYYNRKPQRQDDSYKIPFQNMSGGWSVTLAGSCYTALPSDVEMKVCFPKANQQQTNSQSDSGLGEEKLYQKKHGGGGSNNTAKRCANCESELCANCKTIQECHCKSSLTKRDEGSTNGRLSTSQTRKNSNSKLDNRIKAENDNLSKKDFNYLPDVNSLNQQRMKKKAGLKMARRFSLHCWLPEDRASDKMKVQKMEISETIVPLDGDELSVFGCAIMPEMKPRVPTMSERDLTRVHTAQFYARHRRM